MTDELFITGMARFNVTTAKQLVAEREVAQIETDRLAPVLNFFGCWPDEADKLPDEALTAPHTPLIFATMENGRTMVIDGLHRIYAADKRRVPTLPVATLTREETLAIQVGEVIL